MGLLRLLCVCLQQFSRRRALRNAARADWWKDKADMFDRLSRQPPKDPQ